jgi:hypothetical protein
VNLRERLPELAPTVVANMTSPILRAVAGQLEGLEGGPGRTRSSNSGEARSDPPTTLATLICSGLLPSELDEAAAFFGPAGLIEAERRRDGDWAALLLRRG